jgi:hypothetical protein
LYKESASANKQQRRRRAPALGIPGLCALTTVVKALETRMDEIDYDKACSEC